MNTIGLRAKPGRDSILKFYLSRSYLVFLKIFLLFVKGGKIFAYEYNWIKSRHEFSGESRRVFKFQMHFLKTIEIPINPFVNEMILTFALLLLLLKV